MIKSAGCNNGDVGNNGFVPLPIAVLNTFTAPKMAFTVPKMTLPLFGLVMPGLINLVFNASNLLLPLSLLFLTTAKYLVLSS